MTAQRLITMMKAAVHPNTENPGFGDGVIYVEVHDDAAGAFVTLSQPSAYQIDPEYTGKVMIDYETDWPSVVQAVHTLMRQPGLKDIATRPPSPCAGPPSPCPTGGWCHDQAQSQDRPQHPDPGRAENLRADAARYQWLRRNKWWLGLVDSYEMDRELDEAMKEQP